jgi:hypothetical protein
LLVRPFISPQPEQCATLLLESGEEHELQIAQ